MLWELGVVVVSRWVVASRGSKTAQDRPPSVATSRPLYSEAIADTAESSGSDVRRITLHNPVDSPDALHYTSTAAPIVFSKKKSRYTSRTRSCVLSDEL